MTSGISALFFMQNYELPKYSVVKKIKLIFPFESYVTEEYSWNTKFLPKEWFSNTDCLQEGS